MKGFLFVSIFETKKAPNNLNCLGLFYSTLCPVLI